MLVLRNVFPPVLCGSLPVALSDIMANVEPNTLAGLRRLFNKPDLDVNKC